MKQKISRFDALSVALELVRLLQPLVRRIRSCNRSLADQLSRASQSTCLNLSEGRRRAGRDRQHLFAVASGSNDEARTALEVAVAAGYLQVEATVDALALADRVAAMTWRSATEPVPPGPHGPGVFAYRRVSRHSIACSRSSIANTEARSPT
jgi:four helix bundle protein